MKAPFNYPISIYVAAALASQGIMIILDFILGNTAEHLNAWVILNRLFGHETNIGDSLAIHKFGLLGATFLMLSANFIFGVILIQIINGIIKFIHS